MYDVLSINILTLATICKFLWYKKNKTILEVWLSESNSLQGSHTTPTHHPITNYSIYNLYIFIYINSMSVVFIFYKYSL